MDAASISESGATSGSDRTPTGLDTDKANSAIETDSAPVDRPTDGNHGAQTVESNASHDLVSDSIRMPTRAEDSDRRSILRQPYVLSESIKEECARIAHLAKADCNDHLSAIARLENEVRDAGWADATEASIRLIVESEPGYRVRSLECRSSICALEVESPTDVFSQKHFQAISARISDIDRVFTYEYPSQGVRVKVTSITFQRM